jgi:hypothetical protein
VRKEEASILMHSRGGPPYSIGWVLLIGEDAEQARVLVALIVSIAFLSLHLSIRPLRRYASSVGNAIERAAP